MRFGGCRVTTDWTVRLLENQTTIKAHLLVRKKHSAPSFVWCYRRPPMWPRMNPAADLCVVFSVAAAAVTAVWDRQTKIQWQWKQRCLGSSQLTDECRLCECGSYSVLKDLAGLLLCFSDCQQILCRTKPTMNWSYLQVLCLYPNPSMSHNAALGDLFLHQEDYSHSSLFEKAPKTNNKKITFSVSGE